MRNCPLWPAPSRDWQTRAAAALLIFPRRECAEFPEASVDASGQVRLYAPNPLESGSSVSHFDDVASPNLLMEPAINGDLTQSVLPPQDMTYRLFQDIGWEVGPVPAAARSLSRR